jgi:hypothetical protein
MNRTRFAGTIEDLALRTAMAGALSRGPACEPLMLLPPAVPGPELVHLALGVQRTWGDLLAHFGASVSSVIMVAPDPLTSVTVPLFRLAPSDDDANSLGPAARATFGLVQPWILGAMGAGPSEPLRAQTRLRWPVGSRRTPWELEVDLDAQADDIGVFEWTVAAVHGLRAQIGPGGPSRDDVEVRARAMVGASPGVRTRLEQLGHRVLASVRADRAPVLDQVFLQTWQAMHGRGWPAAARA